MFLSILIEIAGKIDVAFYVSIKEKNYLFHVFILVGIY